jgi:hypothetical protein
VRLLHNAGLIREWLSAPAAQRVCLLLAEFGDGKSFLTYVLARELIRRFRDNPREGTLPLRLALRNYAGGEPRSFIDERLATFGGDLRGWEMIKRDHHTLVILDGFDEMSRELDPESVRRNIDHLLRICGAPILDGCRLLITSRRHFFERPDANRLLCRLDATPLIFGLAPIPRRQVRAQLQHGLSSEQGQAVLARIEAMHDPIGLAQKPLFLQMVKATLGELPDDPDEAVIYDSYARQALMRKAEMLDDPELRSNRHETAERMLALLGMLAEELQRQDSYQISLKAFAEQAGNDLAKRLWELSAERVAAPDVGGHIVAAQEQRRKDLAEELAAVVHDLGVAGTERERVHLRREKLRIERELRESTVSASLAAAASSPLEQDAMAHVGARSLLSRVERDDDSGEWWVEFCHRSMREYFVACRLVEVLAEGPEATEAMLTGLPLNYEILFFAGRLLRRRDVDQERERLLALLERSTVGRDNEGLGGTALTLLAALSPRVPDRPGIDYRRRNYERADLQDSDLSGIDFSGSVFQGANLSNVDLTEADLSRCDLTDVRLDTTPPVRALAPGRGADQVLAAYEDGSVWQWDLTLGHRVDYSIRYSEKGLVISRLGLGEDGVAWALAGRRLLLFDIAGDEPWRCIARIPGAQLNLDFTIDGQVLALLQGDPATELHLIDLASMHISATSPTPESPAFYAPDTELLVQPVDDARLRLVATGSRQGLGCDIPAPKARVACARLTGHGRVLVGWGQEDGGVGLARISAGVDGPHREELLRAQPHKGPVTGLTLLGEDRLVSGGLDRTIVVTQLPDQAGPTSARAQRLERTLRCAGLRVNGLKPERQREQLEALVRAASL